MTASSRTERSQQQISGITRAMWLAIVSVIMLLAAQTAAAQGYGKISGIVTDPSGAAVVGAKVTATLVATGEVTTTTTSGEGTYAFPALRPATYNINAASPNFSTYVQNGLVLQADAALTANITLKVGNTSDTVTVEANAAQVDVTTGTLSQVVEERRINDLPLNGRNAASLTTLVAGVALAPNAQADQGQTKTFPVVVAVTANGSRVGQTSYKLDGGNNVDEYTNVNAPFPFPDALQEFSVQTSNYNAEYGQNAGGVVNIVTKSGGSNYHGDLFEYVRNASFNAPNFFSNNKAVDPLKRNQFGGTVGGPLKLPGVSTPHSYFFAGYQGTILRNSPLSDSAATLPTAAQLNGTFNVANAAACIKNPFTGVVYPCTAGASTPGVSTVDTADYNASSLALLSHLPSGGTSGQVFFRRPTRQNLNEVVGRFDQEIGQKDKLNVRYFYDRFHNDGVLDTSNLLTYADQATIVYQNMLFSETHVFSDHLLNNFIFNYQRDNAGRGPLDGGISVADLGVNIWQPAFKQINQVQVSPGFTIGDNPAATFHRQNYTVSDDLHWVKGSHDMAFGFQGELSRVDLNNQFRQPGFFVFNANVCNDANACFLLGYLNQFQQASGQFFNTRGKFVGFYGQDSWKATRRLTLNYGLRYEPFFPWHEAENRMGAFSPSAFAAGAHSTQFVNAPIGLQFPGDPGMLRDGIRKVFTDFMPRIGFAWDVLGNGKLSVRGGGGMFYDSRLSSVFNNIYSNGSPFVTQVAVTDGATSHIGPFNDPYATFANPFPAPQPPPSNAPFPTQSFLTYDPYHEFQVPRNYNWNLAVEEQLTSSTVVRLAYVGSRGNHLWLPAELNPSVYNPTTDTAPRVYGSVYSQPITAAVYSGNTSYNSLQATFQERFKRGMSLLANYTWSKSLDDLPFNAAVTAIGSNNSFVLPSYEPNFTRLDYGPSDFDHRHVLSLSYVWELPKLKTGWAPLRYIVNDWQTNGIFQYRSGDPLTLVSSSNNISQTSQARDRGVYLGGDPYGDAGCSAVSTLCVGYLNRTAFRTLAGRTKDSLGNITSYGDGPSPTDPNPALRFGNIRKGFVVGPQYADWDASLMRHFKFTERWRGEFRAEYFNVLNHPNFGDPNTTVGSGTFGRITGTSANGVTYDPRIGQLSFKVLF